MRTTTKIKLLASVSTIMFAGTIILDCSYSHRSDSTEKFSVVCDNMVNQNGGFEVNTIYKQDIKPLNFKLKEHFSNQIEDVNGEVLSCFSIDAEYIESSTSLGGMSKVIDMAVEDEVTWKPDSNNNFSQEELQILYRIVESEATDGSIESKKNVASVILNRIKCDEFPDTVEEVVFQKRQFSPISDGRYYKVEITDSTIQAVNEVLQDGVTNEALYFCQYSKVRSSSTRRWFDSMELILVDDIGHHFYK